MFSLIHKRCRYETRQKSRSGKQARAATEFRPQTSQKVIQVGSNNTSQLGRHRAGVSFREHAKKNDAIRYCLRGHLEEEKRHLHAALVLHACVAQGDDQGLQEEGTTKKGTVESLFLS